MNGIGAWKGGWNEKISKKNTHGRENRKEKVELANKLAGMEEALRDLEN